MAVTVASLTSGNNDVAHTSTSTASITPAANKLIVAAIGCYRSLGTAVQPTLSGNGLTWVAINSQTVATGGDSLRVTVFRSMGAAPSTGVITINYGGVTHAFSTWSVVEFDGVDTSGTNGSGAVVQSAVGSGTSTTALATLAAFGSASNATYGASQWNGGPVTEGAGFTELHEPRAFATYSLETEWKNSADTTVDATRALGTQWALVGVEIKEFVAVSPRSNRRLKLGVG